jgi:hypothetical protein
VNEFKPGDDVIVEFDGLEHQGQVEKPVGQGWIRCKIRIDPLADYGSITPRLGVTSIVCVRVSDVRRPT